MLIQTDRQRLSLHIICIISSISAIICILLFLMNTVDQDFNSLTGINRCIVPFVACGDLTAFDSDMTYPMEVILQLVNTMVVV